MVEAITTIAMTTIGYNSYDSGNDHSGDYSGDYSDGSYDSGSDSGSKVTIMEETTAAEIIVETAPAMAVSKMEADIDQ